MTIGILFPFLLIALASYSLWKSCSNFDRYSKVIGDQLTDGVRGATVNAIGSSLPCHQGKSAKPITSMADTHSGSLLPPISILV
jgi:hypothetical protein